MRAALRAGGGPGAGGIEPPAPGARAAQGGAAPLGLTASPPGIFAAQSCARQAASSRGTMKSRTEPRPYSSWRQSRISKLATSVAPVG